MLLFHKKVKIFCDVSLKILSLSIKTPDIRKTEESGPAGDKKKISGKKQDPKYCVYIVNDNFLKGLKNIQSNVKVNSGYQQFNITDTKSIHHTNE